MIRDPSDGSVREKPAAKSADLLSTKNEIANHDNALISTATSGLQTGSQKAENLARLEKSRAWMKSYFKPKDGE